MKQFEEEIWGKIIIRFYSDSSPLFLSFFVSFVSYIGI